ncbi:putative B3 domain-containing protein REM15 isoform X2 [Mercurialis annua]|uniref:putative B3 domain-containing protein REM15 isoform X2 n=1 Tax=Mercurialis annua TaxID=3986 RepID=UPI0024AFADA5|nr:putative B3 domain-containing protein REM15 isoform X2 [Mercurialis annua]
MAEIRRFFKVMMPDLESTLPLPVAFCRQVKQQKWDRAILKSCDREWNITVGKGSDGLLYLENGWEDFVNHHALSFGDFVVFEHNGDFIFDVIVFDSSACQKDFPPVSVNLSSRKKKKKGSKNPLEEAKSYKTNGPHFIKTIRVYNGVKIPAEFGRSENLERASVIILRDDTGKLWPVKLCTKSGRTTMKKGWGDFYVAKKLKKGDVCLFEVDSSRRKCATLVMDVHVFVL